jgi:hypothetical protein
VPQLLTFRAWLLQEAGDARARGEVPGWHRQEVHSLLKSIYSSDRLNLQRVSHHLLDATNRYLLDGDSKLQVHWEKHEHVLNAVQDEKSNSSLPRAIRDFVLPAGFPGE